MDSVPAAPSAPSEPRWPRPFLPALLPGLPPALFLLALWWFQTRHEIDPRGAFHPANVVQEVIGPVDAQRLRDSAEVLGRKAEILEARGLEPGLAEAEARSQGAFAARLRARADTLKAGADAREALLVGRHAKRVLWVYTTCVDVMLCGFAGLLSLGAIALTLRRRRFAGTRVLGVLAAVTVLALLPAVLLFHSWPDALPQDHLVAVTAGDAVKRLMRGLDAMHLVSVSLIMWVGVFGIPAHSPWRGVRLPATADDLARATRELAEAHRLWRIALYTAAVMLVGYVAAVSSLFQWVLAFVPSEGEVSTAVGGLANSVVTARGIMASGIMVFGFGTSAVLFRSLTDRLAALALPDALPREQEAWAQEQGLLATDFRQQLKALAAILAPLATGTIAQIVQSLG